MFKKSINTLISGSGKSISELMDELSKEMNGGATSINMHETKSEYVVEILAPGMSKEDVSVKFEGDTLVVSAKKTEGDVGDPVFREFSYAEFTRSIKFPGAVDFKGASAKMENGILTVKIKKAEGGPNVIQVD